MSIEIYYTKAPVPSFRITSVLWWSFLSEDSAKTALVLLVLSIVEQMSVSCTKVILNMVKHEVSVQHFTFVWIFSLVLTSNVFHQTVLSNRHVHVLDEPEL